MTAMVSVSQQRVNRAREALDNRKSFLYNCKTEDGLTVVPNQEAMAIRVKKTGNGNNGRTGVIPCLNGFTAEVREIVPAHHSVGIWHFTIAIVPKDFPIDYFSGTYV